MKLRGACSPRRNQRFGHRNGVHISGLNHSDYMMTAEVETASNMPLPERYKALLRVSQTLKSKCCRGNSSAFSHASCARW
jgi:hypothetical protein